MKHIYIIYNPNSTGDSQSNAHRLESELKRHHISSHLVSTEHAGHARQLARQYSGPDTMVVSSSGDGGFNEIINGVLTSQYPDTIVGLLPSGNANDHYSARHQPDLIDRIVAQDITRSDALKVSWGDQVHYAHSYAGLGISAEIGKQLSQYNLNPLVESWLVVRNLFRHRPVKIILDGRTKRYDSFVCSVISQMAKYLNFPDDAPRPNGQFAIIRTKSGSIKTLLRHFLHLTVGSPETLSAREINFTTTSPTSMQLDGEIVELPANSAVKIECLDGAIKSII